MSIFFSKILLYVLMSLHTVISGKYAHPPFLNEIVAKGAFLLKVRPPICAVVHAVMSSKKQYSTLQEEGVTNEVRQHLLLFSREMSQLSKICPLPL